MSLYGATLFVHSYLRWAILIVAVVVLVRAFGGMTKAREWTATDNRWHAALLGLTDAQLTLGFLLYLVLSPISSAFFAGFPATMKNSMLRFFGVEHVLPMLVAVALLHVGRARSKKAPTPALRHRRVFSWSAAGLLFLLAGIPWPFYPSGRPLFAGLEPASASAAPAPAPVASAPATSAEACPPLYRERCASCHGERGQGDGPAARVLKPPPRNFADSAWAASKSDADVAAVIREGGTARGLSPLMPPHPDLPPREVDALVSCVRTLQGKPR